VYHDRGKPLIVDEAWGAHLPFHEDLPTWAMDAGADVCVVSVHKMGAGFEQGSVFHLQGDLVDRDRLSACADLLMTTSPNVLVYSAMDGWRRQMVEHGRKLLSGALALARELRKELGGISGVEVLDEQIRRECVRVRQQQVQIVRGPVEPVTSDQATRAGADEVQLERLGGQAGRQPHRHRGLVLDLAAAGDDRLGDATDQPGRLDRLLHRVEDVRGLVGV